MIKFNKKKNAREEDIQYLKENYKFAQKDLRDICYAPEKFSIVNVLIKLKNISMVLTRSYIVTGNKSDLELSRKCHEVIQKINFMPEQYDTIVRDLQVVPF